MRSTRATTWHGTGNCLHRVLARGQFGVSRSSTVLRSVRSDETFEAAGAATRCELSCPRPPLSKFDLCDEVEVLRPPPRAGCALAVVGAVLSARRAASRHRLARATRSSLITTRVSRAWHKAHAWRIRAPSRQTFPACWSFPFLPPSPGIFSGGCPGGRPATGSCLGATLDGGGRRCRVRLDQVGGDGAAVRNNERKWASLLPEDFAEFGRFGRLWNHLNSVVAFRNENPRELPARSEWRFHAVSPEPVLVTCRIHGVDGDSRHCSLWELAGPVLRFHQGTMISVR